MRFKWLRPCAPGHWKSPWRRLFQFPFPQRRTGGGRQNLGGLPFPSYPPAARTSFITVGAGPTPPPPHAATPSSCSCPQLGTEGAPPAWAPEAGEEEGGLPGPLDRSSTAPEGGNSVRSAPLARPPPICHPRRLESSARPPPPAQEPLLVHLRATESRSPMSSHPEAAPVARRPHPRRATAPARAPWIRRRRGRHAAHCSARLGPARTLVPPPPTPPRLQPRRSRGGAVGDPALPRALEPPLR
jgi:hypothetical protein